MSDSSSSAPSSPSRSRSRSPAPTARRTPASASAAPVERRRSSAGSSSGSDSDARRRIRARGRARARKAGDSSSPSPSPSRSRSPIPARRRRRSASSSSSSPSGRSASPSPPPAARRTLTRASSRSPDHQNDRLRARTTAAVDTHTDDEDEQPAKSSLVPAAKARSRRTGPAHVSPALLVRPALSLHPPVYRVRFSLRLSQTCANASALSRRSELQALCVDLLLNECGAHAGASHAPITPQDIEYVQLRKVEERAKAKAKQAYALFSGAGGSASLASSGPAAGVSNSVVWHATVVLLCPSESTAEYIVSHLQGLNTSAQGYAVSVECVLLASSRSSYELRSRWEQHYFPTLIDHSARAAGAAFGPTSFQITLAFKGMPAGQRPDTIVLRYVPVSWVDGSLLSRRGRQRERAKLTHSGPPPPPSPFRMRFCGSMEEDDVASLSASEVDSGSDEEEREQRAAGAPTWRRKLLIVKRQLELLLSPAAAMAHLPSDKIVIRRWEYRAHPDVRTSLLRKAKTEPGSAAAVGAVTDEMLTFPLLNPYPSHTAIKGDALLEPAAPSAGGDEQKESSSSSNVIAAAPTAPPAPMVPLCDVYLMLEDYASMLACFDYLHSKRMQNALDRSADESSDEEQEEVEEEGALSATGSSLLSPGVGRIIDFGVDVDREGFLKFDHIEHRRQLLCDERDRIKAAAQLAAHTARKRKEQQILLERERALRKQEEEAERAEAEKRAQQEAELREVERQRAAAEQRAREEARAQREALDAIDRMRRLEDKQRQAARRAQQRAEEQAALGLPAESPMDAEEAALLAEEQRAEEERLIRRKQLEAIRRRKQEEEAAARNVPSAASASSFSPPARAARPTVSAEVIDLDAPEWGEVQHGTFTPTALALLEQWLEQRADGPTPTDTVLTQVARAARLSVAQVKEWIMAQRKAEWKFTTSNAPIIKASARSSASSAAAAAAANDMPGLLSAGDEAADAMSARRAAAAAAQQPISMVLKTRPKVQTDEETNTDGFVRVDGLDAAPAGAGATSTPAALPASHPLYHPSFEESYAAAEMKAMAAEHQAARSAATVERQANVAPAVLDKVAMAVAALEAKIKGGGGSATAPPATPGAAAPASAEDAAMPPADGATTAASATTAAAPEAEGDASRKRSRSRSGSASRSRSRSPGSKKKSKKHRKDKHRSSSRGRKSSRKSRRSRSPGTGADPMLPFFPFPPPFGFPPFGFPPAPMPPQSVNGGGNVGANSSRSSRGNGSSSSRDMPLIMPPPPHMMHPGMPPNFDQFMAARMGFPPGFPPPQMTHAMAMPPPSMKHERERGRDRDRDGGDGGHAAAAAAAIAARAAALGLPPVPPVGMGGLPYFPPQMEEKSHSSSSRKHKKSRHSKHAADAVPPPFEEESRWRADMQQ